MSNVALKNKLATKVKIDNHIFTVSLYDTEVYRLDLVNRTITLKTGGWQTVTTKRRINQAFSETSQPFQIVQRSYAWYVQHKNGKMIRFDNVLTFNIDTFEEV